MEAKITFYIIECSILFFTCVFVCGALVLSIIVFYWGRKETASRLLLEQASKGFEEVINLLRDQNNNRQVWVRAARTLLKTKNLKKRILLQEYVEGFEAVEERVRNELYANLTILDEKTGERSSLPPQFFYGINNWREIEKLDDAAILSKGNAVVSDVTIDNVLPIPRDQSLAKESVVAIYNFLKYPNNYIDPLKSVNLWDDNWEMAWGESDGARKYVAHRTLGYAINGKWFKYNRDKTE